MYKVLAEDYKKELYHILFSLYSLCTTAGMTLNFASHEFVIRCEQYGVRKKEWEASLTASGEVDTSLLSPKAMLKQFVEMDVEGRLRRLVELSSTPADLLKCLQKLATQLPETSNGSDEKPAGQSGKQSDKFAEKCQLVSRVLSKIRRVVQPPVEDEEEAETVRACGHEAVALLQLLVSMKPSNATQNPVDKFVHFAAWAAPLHLIHEEDSKAIEHMQRSSNDSLAQTALQMEAVAVLKSLPPDGDTAALTAVLEEMWEKGSGTHFSPSSSDVLSSIASAANLKAISEEAKDMTAQRLAATHRYLQKAAAAAGGPPAHPLPRRALMFVNARKQLATQQARSEEVRKIVLGE